MAGGAAGMPQGSAGLGQASGDPRFGQSVPGGPALGTPMQAGGFGFGPAAGAIPGVVQGAIKNQPMVGSPLNGGYPPNVDYRPLPSVNQPMGGRFDNPMVGSPLNGGYPPNVDYRPLPSVNQPTVQGLPGRGVGPVPFDPTYMDVFHGPTGLPPGAVAAPAVPRQVATPAIQPAGIAGLMGALGATPRPVVSAPLAPKPTPKPAPVAPGRPAASAIPVSRPTPKPATVPVKGNVLPRGIK